MQNPKKPSKTSRLSLSPVKSSKLNSDRLLHSTNRRDIRKNVYEDPGQHSGSSTRKLKNSNSHTSLKSYSSKKSQERLDNLNQLLEKCTSIQNIKNRLPLISQVSLGFGRLRKSIEDYETKNKNFQFDSERELKKDSITMKNDFLKESCLRGNKKYINRFKSIRIHRKTEKIIAMISSKLALIK